MVNAASVDKNDNFRNFLFLFVSSFFRDLGGHLFVDYFDPRSSEPRTPVRMTGSIGLGYQDNGSGDSGRYLEAKSLGGNIEFYGEPHVGAHPQVSLSLEA